MTKEKIMDLLFEMLKEQDKCTFDVTQDSEKNTLKIQVPTGEGYVIAIDPAEDYRAKFQIDKGLSGVYVQITLLAMQQNGLISADEYQELWGRVKNKGGLL